MWSQSIKVLNPYEALAENSQKNENEEAHK